MTAMIHKILLQDKVWLTADGVMLPISEMDQTHRLNTRAFLQRRASYLKWYVDAAVQRTTLDQLTKQRVIECDPMVWLNNTPFVRALDKAIRDHGSVDGEVVDVTYEQNVLNS